MSRFGNWQCIKPSDTPSGVTGLNGQIQSASTFVYGEIIEELLNVSEFFCANQKLCKFNILSTILDTKLLFVCSTFFNTFTKWAKYINICMSSQIFENLMAKVSSYIWNREYFEGEKTRNGLRWNFMNFLYLAIIDFLKEFLLSKQAVPFNKVLWIITFIQNIFHYYRYLKPTIWCSWQRRLERPLI